MNFIFYFFLTSLICGGLQLYIYINNNNKKKNDNNKNLDISNDSSGGGNSSSNFLTNNEEKQFKKFQNKYLITYLLAMASDWLQGPYVYALYESYGFSKQDIAILFIFGFLSSLVFGMGVGPIIDKYGRKRMGIVFGLLYGASCLTKLVNDFTILLIGRLLGGIATSLLFSVFESWMIAEHNSKGFNSELLSKTFYKSTLLNGLIAIGSGLFSSQVASKWGYVSPFLWAFGLLMICSILISILWNENYGDSSSSLSTTFSTSFKTVLSDPSIISLGTIQALFEGSMYTFVFMWTPTLLESSEIVGNTTDLPFGLIFATFMVCVMIGSSLFNLLTNIKPEILIQYILIISSISLFIPFLFTNSLLIYLSFLIFETCCGLYFPCAGTLRSIYIPESIRATTMNLFRVPLNLLVVVMLTNISRISNQGVFLNCTFWLLIATIYYKITLSKTIELKKLNN